MRVRQPQPVSVDVGRKNEAEDVMERRLAAARAEMARSAWALSEELSDEESEDDNPPRRHGGGPPNRGVVQEARGNGGAEMDWNKYVDDEEEEEDEVVDVEALMAEARAEPSQIHAANMAKLVLKSWQTNLINGMPFDSEEAWTCRETVIVKLGSIQIAYELIMSNNFRFGTRYANLCNMIRTNLNDIGLQVRRYNGAVRRSRRPSAERCPTFVIPDGVLDALLYYENQHA